MTVVVVARLPSTVEARMNHALVERLNVFGDVASAVLLVVILCAKTAIIGAVDRKIAPSASASSGRRNGRLRAVTTCAAHAGTLLLDDGGSERALVLHGLVGLGRLEASRSLRLVIVLLVGTLR